MKKTLTVLALTTIMALGAISPALAGWWGRGWGWGESGSGTGNCGGPCYTQDLDAGNDKARQDFLEESRDLRQQLFDRKEAYFELMGQENPDKEAAAAIWSEIFDLQNQLRKMADEAGVGPAQGRGGDRGYGPADCGGPGCGYGPRGGRGRGCNGPGFER